jgi:hypothetical protein
LGGVSGSGPAGGASGAGGGGGASSAGAGGGASAAGAPAAGLGALAGRLPNGGASLLNRLAEGSPLPVHDHLTPSTGGAIDYLRTQWGTDHLAAPDPHAQYLQQSEADLLYAPIGSGGGATDVTITTDASLSSVESPANTFALAARRSATAGNSLALNADGLFVPDFLTQAEGDARYPLAGATDPYPQYATDADLTAHAAAADPHPVYLTEPEGDARYLPLSYTPPPADVTVTGDSGVGVTESPPNTFALATRVSADANNTIELRPTGLYAAAGAIPPEYLTVSEADTLYVSLTGDTVTGALVLQGATSATTVLQGKLAADTQPRFRADASGKLEWGPGGATAPDWALTRVATGLSLRGALLAAPSSTYDLGAATGAWDSIYGNRLEVVNSSGYVRIGASAQAAAGAVRLRNAAAVAWRNAANGGDLTLAADASDRLAYSGTTLMLAGDTAATLQRTGAGALRVDTNLGVGVAPTSALMVQGEVVSQGGVGGYKFVSRSNADFYQWYADAAGAYLYASSGSRGLVGVSRTGTLTLTPDAGQTALVANGSAVITPVAGSGALTVDVHVGSPRLTTSAGTNLAVAAAAGIVYPSSHNNTSLGAASNAWTTVYATNGAIQPSAAAVKEAITPLDPAAALAAVLATDPVVFDYKPPERTAEWYDLPDDPEQAEAVLHQRLTSAPLEAAARHQAGFVLQDATGQYQTDPLFETGEGQSNAANSVGVLLAAIHALAARLTALEGA